MYTYIHTYWTWIRQIHRVWMDRCTHACVVVRAESRGKQKPPHVRAKHNIWYVYDNGTLPRAGCRGHWYILFSMWLLSAYLALYRDHDTLPRASGRHCRSHAAGTHARADACPHPHNLPPRLTRRRALHYTSYTSRVTVCLRFKKNRNKVNTILVTFETFNNKFFLEVNFERSLLKRAHEKSCILFGFVSLLLGHV